MSQAAPRITRRFAHVDAALLLTLALSAFSLWPLLYRPGLPNGNDVLYHVFRAAEMSRAWEHGVLFPRWAESFYTGYGAPVFHYYASLSYTVTSLLMRLFALDALNALRLLIALAMLGGGAGMYAFARGYGGRLGGVIAALCYVYSPYLLFTEPYSRGAYPEMSAFALFPWVMAAFARVRRTGGALALVTAAALAAALILTHNLMALALTGLLAGWLLWPVIVKLFTNGSADLRSLLPAFAALGLGIGLAAYFWLPVMLESGEVRLGNLTAVAQLDYRRFFVPLDDLLAFSPRYDEGALNGLFHRFNLGVAQWVLAFAGLVGAAGAAARRRRGSRRQYVSATESDPVFFALAAAACIVLMLPAAEAVWAWIRPLAYLQFPWRLLGPAAFCLALLAGTNARWIWRLTGHAPALVTAGVAAAIIGLALPALYAPEWTHESVNSSVAAYHTEELAGRQRATTFSNEYLPRAVLVEPDATPRLVADYGDGYPVNKAHLETLPANTSVGLLEHGPQHDVWRVSAETPFTLEVLTFDFAGWAASVDGEPVPITPSDPHGLITFPVPAGEHLVRLELGSTPARNAGNVLSLGALAALAAAAAWLAARQKSASPRPPYPHKAVAPAPEISGQGGYRGVSTAPLPYSGLIAGGLLALLLAALLLREGGAWVASPPGTALLAQHPVQYHVGDQIHLIGYDLNGTVFRPGGRLELRLYWYTEGAIAYGYSSFVHLSTGGPPLAQADKLNPADRPTREWTGGGYIRDDYTITLPDDLPPAVYQLTVGLYTCDTRPPGDCGSGDRPTITDAAGSAIGDAVPLGTVEVR